ncbi:MULTISPECIES: FHA domain-containing protein [unclassified Microbacterium]|uniref:FHA domain-containing protein FhaB/FipA n=1 Tax=unclassified Microbacterium TaxID=2609290 RepID=UPI0012FA22FD|nr:FHA domain-containing protein [Microbacterium sp. MAH-37]MVQ44105.1 FHA domain-containing protein [Microbacterium sp. MAH-37]
MSELVLLLLRIAFLVLLWFFVFGVIYSLRADLFGVRVRKLPAGEAAASATPAPAAPAKGRSTGPATTSTATKLVITSGPKAGLEVPLGTEPLSIGRSSESGLVIRDDYTSSHHARLVPRGGTWTIQDLESTNGTYLNGQRLTGPPVPISIGTPIKVGATTFELRA